jgi:hypothetical protein
LSFDRVIGADKSQVGTVSLSVGVGLGLALVPALSFAFGQLFLLLGGRISAGPAFILLALVLAASLGSAWRLTRDWRAPAIIAAILVLATIASGFVIDTSYDGQEYHYDGAVALAQGWNPLWHPTLPAEFVASVGPLPMWVLHYPEASWISGALQIAVGIPPEAAKSQTILLMAALCFSAFGMARNFGLSLWIATAVGLLAAANPVFIVQMFTRMNDALMAGYLALAVLFSIWWVLRGARWAIVAAFVMLPFALNLKFSGLPMAVFACAMICVFALRMRGTKRALQIGGLLMAAGILGVVVLGAHPYVTNTLREGHPFYPVVGDAKTDIEAIEMPPYLAPFNEIEKLGVSYFSATSSGFFEPHDKLKLPFMIYPFEMFEAGQFDARVAGFGPWFSGAILMSLALAIWLLVGKRQAAGQAVLLSAAGALAVFSLVLPASWWARYVTYLWWAPLLIAIAALLADGAWRRRTAWALLAVMAVNTAMVSASSARYVANRNLDIHRQITEMRETPGQICLHPGLLHSRLPLLGDLKDRVSISHTPLSNCEASTLVSGFDDTAAYCACP